MNSLAVLDSSAILAVVFNETGGDIVLPLLRGGLLSTVNLAEVHTRLVLRGVGADFAWRRVMAFGCEVSFFDDLQARLAGELVAQTRPYGLSLGDRACLALAIQRKATVYTTDAAWKNLNLGIRVEVIR
ncbi:MAG: type II toxin-antitoxin system VapC family toxin [Terracidiphilus sp.]